MARRKKTTDALLQELLAGRAVDDALLDEFFQQFPREDVHLEYKSGQLFDDIERARVELRRQIAGFASADGGILVIGVSDPTIDRLNGELTKPPALDAAPEHVGGQELRFWIRDLLVAMHHAFGQVPLFPEAIRVHGGCVQLVVVARAPAPVAVIEDRPRYYFRFGDSTREADPWLLTDLHLGRRRQPLFALATPSDYRHPRGPAGYLTGAGPTDRGFTLELDVENNSLTHAHEVRVGILGLCREQGRRPISSALRERIALEGAPRNTHLCYSQLVAVDSKHGARDAAAALYPFDLVRFAMQERWLMPLVSPIRARFDLWWGALFVVAADCEPAWFQVVILHGHKKDGAAQDFHVDIYPTWSDRPRVAVEQEPLPPEHVMAKAREIRERGRSSRSP